VKNVHFEEQVKGEEMSFDYRLRTGIVQSSNALRLMKIVGLDVMPADAAPPPNAQTLP
jgi:DNA mismatch repair ATPase MutS